MTKEEIIKNLDQLESARFYNNMVDHWTDYHYQRDRELASQINELKKELEAVK